MPGDGMGMTHTTHNQTAMTPLRTLLLATLMAAAFVAAGVGTGTSLAQPTAQDRPSNMQSGGMDSSHISEMGDVDMEEMAEQCAQAMDDMTPQMEQMMQRADGNGMRGMMGSSMMNGTTR